MNPQWLDFLENKVDEIKSSTMDDYFHFDAEKIKPSIMVGDFHIEIKPISSKKSEDASSQPPFSDTKYLVNYFVDTRNAYARVSTDDFLRSLDSELMQSYGFAPESYYNNSNEPRYDVVRILQDAYNIYTYEYLKLYIKASSKRRYASASNNNDPFSFYVAESCNSYMDASSLRISPEDIINAQSPFVSELQDDGFYANRRMTMLFSPIRKPFVELAKEYDLFNRGRVTGYNLNKLAGYDRRNFEGIFDPENKHKITPGQMFAICLICRLEAKEAINFFHTCEELHELSDYAVPGAVLVAMLTKKCYDYEVFLKICCETFKHMNAELPDYLSSNSKWKETFEQQ